MEDELVMSYEKWIGEKDNTSGSYYPTLCAELHKRHSDRRLYRFKSKLNDEYYITDEKVVAEIESLIEKGNADDLYEYLISVVIQRFGIHEFLMKLELKMKEKYAQGFEDGRKRMQHEIKKLIGL